MKDQSQIDDMRAAIRGERERARKRPRPSQVVQPRDEVRDRLQPVPETEDVPQPGLLSGLFKRR
jgi:hypothetical protein